MLLSVLLALAVITVTARLAGAVFARLNQPPVIGEVVGGILLGPSLLGRVAPALQGAIFPADVVPVLGAIAQAGVILYMFLVGLELDLRLLRTSIRNTIVIALSAIIVPFAVGVLLALVLRDSLAAPSIDRASFVLFTGVALSITAFPVLARILQDRGMQRTPLGTLALTCAAINDAIAWSLLAFTIGVMQAPTPAGMRTAELTAAAFVIGALIPHHSISVRNTERITAAVRVLFLPSFFALTGLRTEIGLIETASEWLLCGLIIAVATAGKFGGTAIAARLTGIDWRTSSALGILMNTRGLVELIVLNIGLDLGVITPRLFTMLVIMAIVTTMMTSPLLTWVLGRNALEKPRERFEEAEV